MDSISRTRRSWNMSRISGKNTSPELSVRSFLHGLGFRFRLHDRRLPGKPDIVLKKYRTVIFVHGCFWHQHKGCRFAYSPKSNVDFWSSKFARNGDRHDEVTKALKRLHWRVVVIWECELKDMKKLEKKLLKSLPQTNL
jgi:DNA mismatch endonuclease (patch repair protein)